MLPKAKFSGRFSSCRERIWAIPGFLGLPTDWNFLNWHNLTGVDLNACPWISLTHWANHFNHSIHSENSILMGYSLGGRLALHALIDQPRKWSAAIIISAHCGLADRYERERRKQQDQQWAERFEKEEWASLMKAWSERDVFAQDLFHFNRNEQNYHRKQLSNMLIHGSLAQQEDLRSQIANLPMPILWMTGDQDKQYCTIAESLRFAHHLSRWVKIAQAGHRVPWSQPDVFSQNVQAFVELCYDL